MPEKHEGPTTSSTGALADAQARSARVEARLQRTPGSHRVLTGDRPTGPLHLGHYFGTLHNRVRLQDLGVELMVVVADYQTITDRDSPASLPGDVDALLADYLAVGIDPERARSSPTPKSSISTSCWCRFSASSASPSSRATRPSRTRWPPLA